MFCKSVADFTIASLLVATPCAATEAAPEVFEGKGIVATAQQTDTLIRFEFYAVDQHFIINTNGLSNLDAIKADLADSSSTSRSILVRYGVDGGVDPTGTKPSYAVNRLFYKGVWLDTPAATNGTSTPARDPAISQLARGIALSNQGDEQSALRALDDALGTTSLTPPLVSLALKTRGNVYSALALLAKPEGEERDALLVSALKDFAAWRKDESAGAAAAEAYADTLAELGAYDDMLAAYDDIARKWPDEFFNVKIRQGAVLRREGKYAEALAKLDELVAQKGWQTGMRYHYHRGWTLIMLGRYEEAEREFTEGLSGQPDYGWAFLRRACARSQQGHLEDALADQEEGERLLEADAGAFHDATLESDTARAKEVADHLHALVSQKALQADDEACKGYFDFPARARERSPLLKQLPH